MHHTIFQQRFKLNFTQCYANGLLKYNELSNLLQLTAAAHAEQHGYGAMDMIKQEQAWVLSRIRLEIAALPKFLEEITVHTWIADFQGNRLTRNFEVYDAEKCIVSASSLWVVLDLKTRRPGQLYKAVAEELILSERSATKAPVKRIDKAATYAKEAAYRVKLSDLDIVNHVNNVKYTDWCLDTLPAELVLQRSYKSLDMNYLRELHLEQEVNILHSIEPGQLNFAIQKAGQAVFLMEIGL